MILITATTTGVLPATKWRHAVAMGVSPWNKSHHRAISPEGTIGNQPRPVHVAPSGLRVRLDLPIHGLTPVATTYRPFGTNVLIEIITFTNRGQLELGNKTVLGERLQTGPTL